MVIIGGGIYRSRKIEVPSYLDVPTKSIVRLAIGNALSTYLNGRDALDLFAGSGAVGIELISRGAKSCTFMDNNIEAISTIEKNLKTLGINNCDLYYGDYRDNLNKLKNENKKFSLVFIDPPYADKDAYNYSFDFLLNNDLIKKDGIIVIEYEGNNPLLNSECFKEERTYKYGRTNVTIYWR